MGLLQRRQTGLGVATAQLPQRRLDAAQQSSINIGSNLGLQRIQKSKCSSSV
jgi:hypothetical protein